MDRSDRLQLFVTVVECGSFSAAAARNGITRSLVSKQIRALERDLGVRLLNRTTRSSSLTDVGRRVYALARGLRAQLREIEALVASAQATVGGELRLACATHFGRRHLLPVLLALAAAHPALRFDVRLDDRQVDLVGEGVDVAVRIARPGDSTLVARKLTDNPVSLVASPAYRDTRGLPRTVRELAVHRTLVYAREEIVVDDWQYYRGREVRSVRVAPAFKASDGDLLLDAAVAGAGIALLPDFMLGAALAAGKLLRVLPKLALVPYAPVYLIYPGRAHLPPRTRVFIEAMTAHVRASGLA